MRTILRNKTMMAMMLTFILFVVVFINFDVIATAFSNMNGNYFTIGYVAITIIATIYFTGNRNVSHD